MRRILKELYQVCPKSVPSDVVAKILLLWAKKDTGILTLMAFTEQSNRTRFRNDCPK
ncbi:MAG: hypothetical protein ACE5D0_02100 [Fidelibacterota bacterium]